MCKKVFIDFAIISSHFMNLTKCNESNVAIIFKDFMVQLTDFTVIMYFIDSSFIITQSLQC